MNDADEDPKEKRKQDKDNMRSNFAMTNLALILLSAVLGVLVFLVKR
ncbi:hypothetical protein [Delftia acidovorans]|mgnify:CR=1 FL=1